MDAALDEIAEGRLRALLEHRWEVKTHHPAQRMIEAERFSPTEWVLLLGWQRLQDRRHTALQEAPRLALGLEAIAAGELRLDPTNINRQHWTKGGRAKLEKVPFFTKSERAALLPWQDAHDRLRADLEAEKAARDEIAGGYIKPKKEIGKWEPGPNYDEARLPELRRKLTCKWQPAAWQRLRDFAASITRPIEAALTDLKGRISSAREQLTRLIGQQQAASPGRRALQEIADALDPPQPEAASATLFSKPPPTAGGLFDSKDSKENTSGSAPSPSPSPGDW